MKGHPWRLIVKLTNPFTIGGDLFAFLVELLSFQMWYMTGKLLLLLLQLLLLLLIHFLVFTSSLQMNINSIYIVSCDWLEVCSIEIL